MIENFNYQKAFGEKSCVQCGRCCANILMISPKEIKLIKEYIQDNNIKVINRNNFLLLEDVNICPFLKDDGDKAECLIYEVRPSICRSFSCNPKFSKEMEYENVEAINMLFTFGGPNQFSVKAPDLTLLNTRIKELRKIINK